MAKLNDFDVNDFNEDDSTPLSSSDENNDFHLLMKQVEVKFSKEYPIPENAMYGRLAVIAKNSGIPWLSWIYCALLGTYAGLYALVAYRAKNPINLFIALLGSVNSGKSVSIERAIDLINPISQNVINVVPASDRGFCKIFAPPKPKKGDPPEQPTLDSWLLKMGELRGLMAKVMVPGSSLGTALCTAWDGVEFGVADRSGMETVQACVSIVGGLKADDAAEFREVFGSETNHGLYDRFIIVPQPERRPMLDHREYPPVEVGKTKVTVTDEDESKFSDWVYELPAGSLIQRPPDTQLARRGRLKLMAKRVAILTASANNEDHLTPECIAAAINFARWQEAIRMGGYHSSDAVTENAVIETAIMEGFTNMAETSHNPYIKVRFRDFAAKKLYRKWGSKSVNSIRDSLVDSDILEAETEGKRRTGLYRLTTSYYDRLQAGKVNRNEQ
jgi:hypothetical protein